MVPTPLPVPSSAAAGQSLSGETLASAGSQQPPQLPLPVTPSGTAGQSLSGVTPSPDRSIKEDVVHIMFRYKKDGLASTAGNYILRIYFT